MQEDDKRSAEGTRKNKVLFLVVGLGMALFISGFVLAITSLSEPAEVSADADSLRMEESGPSGLSSSLLLGLLLSLAGVVMATAGPAAFFIQARKNCL